MASITCMTSAGFQLDCKKGVGGIKSFWLTDLNYFSKGTNTVDGTSEQITALESSLTWYQFDLPRNTGSLTQAVSVENNAVFYSQTLEATFPYLTPERRKQLEIITRGRHVAIVRGSNDNYWLLGFTDGVEITAQTSQTGVAKGDLNGSTITMLAEEPYSMYRIAEAVVSNDFDGTVVAGSL